MVRRLSVILCALLLGGLIAPAFYGCGEGGGHTLETIQRERLAYVGTVPFEPPLLYQREGELVGPDAELARMIVDRIDETRDSTVGSEVRLTWINRSYPSLVPALSKGEVHMVLGVFGITEERKEEIAFSDPYYTSELRLVVNPVNNDLSEAELGSANIGVREGTAIESFVAENYPNATLTKFSTLDDAILTLRRSELDGVIDDLYMATYSLATTPGVAHLELVPGALGTVECAVGVRKGDNSLLELINGVIAELKQENLYAQWVEEHEAQQYVAEVQERRESRLEEEAKAKEPRQIMISVRKDSDYDFDHYRMANLRFVFRDQASSQSYRTSPISFQGRVGHATASVPPGSYTLSLPQFNFSYPVEIFPSDGDRVPIRIQLSSGGVIVRRG